MKDTLFLSKDESEWMEKGGGGVAALGAETRPQPNDSEPGKDRVSVERVGELGQRKIPGLHLTGWGFSIQHKVMKGAWRKREVLRTDRWSSKESRQRQNCGVGQ